MVTYSNIPEELRGLVGNLLTPKDAASFSLTNKAHRELLARKLNNIKKQYQNLQSKQMNLFWLAHPARQPRTNADREKLWNYRFEYEDGERALERFRKTTLALLGK
jgi:hypothetical protein